MCSAAEIIDAVAPIVVGGIGLIGLFTIIIIGLKN